MLCRWKIYSHPYSSTSVHDLQFCLSSTFLALHMNFDDGDTTHTHKRKPTTQQFNRDNVKYSNEAVMPIFIESSERRYYTQRGDLEHIHTKIYIRGKVALYRRGGHLTHI